MEAKISAIATRCGTALAYRYLCTAVLDDYMPSGLPAAALMFLTPFQTTETIALENFSSFEVTNESELCLGFAQPQL